MLIQKLLGASTTSPPITFVGAVSAAPGASNSFSVSFPSGTQVGDLAIIIFNCATTTGFNSTGWTLATGVIVGLNSNFRSQVLQRTVSSLSDQVFTVSVTPSSVSYTVLTFRNASFGTISNFPSTNSTDRPNSPSLTGSYRGVVSAAAVYATSLGYTVPSGYSLSSSYVSAAATSIVASHLLTSITDPDPAAYTSGGTAAYISYTIGLI